MAKNKTKKKAAKSSEVIDREFFYQLYASGEVLGNMLIEQMSQYGCSFEGLVIETYALSKAWAALKAIGHNQGCDVEELFERLTPSFKNEMEGLVEGLTVLMEKK